MKAGDNIARAKGRTDNSCYFGGLWIGYCKDAKERERYDVLMRINNSEAARILKEYRGFSPELKDILKRVAAYEASRPKR